MLFIAPPGFNPAALSFGREVVTIGFIRAVDYDTIKFAPLGAGAVLCDLPDVSEDSILDVLTEEPGAQGFHLGGMTSAPTFGEDQEEVDFSENLVGADGSYMGMIQPMSVDPTITVEIAKLNVRNLKLVRPDFDATERLARGTRAGLTVGATNARFRVEAAAWDESGNDFDLQVVNPATNNAALSVDVLAGTGNRQTIRVSLATNGSAAAISTANQIIAAINADPEARLIAIAFLPTGSDGTGVAAGASLAPLTGGVDGERVGTTLERRGFYKITDYIRNVVLVCPMIDPDTGAIRTAGWAIELDNCLNRSDSFEYEPDDGGNIAGVEMELRAHLDLRNLNKATGRARPSYRIHTIDMEPLIA